jgi:uncharacterized Fe-S cluster-containing MiaB family protein
VRRYAYITEKYPREAILLRSTGCEWGRCAFCDYQDDRETDETACAAFNAGVLAQVRGTSGVLEAIDSASFSELPAETAAGLVTLCGNLRIRRFITEQYWRFRGKLAEIRRRFASVACDTAFIAGVETFDEDFREKVLKKGMSGAAPADIARYYQWVNLLVGVEGQTLADIQRDIDLALSYFERCNICVFTPNRTAIKRDAALVEAFYESGFFAALRDDPRVEILDPLDERAPDTLGGVGYEE